MESHPKSPLQESGFEIAQRASTYNRSLATSEIVDELLRLLQDDRDLITRVTGTLDSCIVEQWACGDDIPNIVFETRLRTAYELSVITSCPDSPHLSRSWLISPNPYLDEYSLMDLISRLTFAEDTALIEACPQLAAIAFVDDDATAPPRHHD